MTTTIRDDAYDGLCPGCRQPVLEVSSRSGITHAYRAVREPQVWELARCVLCGGALPERRDR